MIFQRTILIFKPTNNYELKNTGKRKGTKLFYEETSYLRL